MIDLLKTSVFKQENIRKQWIVKIRRDEGPFFKITSWTVVCSKHFEKHDYKWTPVVKTLKPGAVPSVFNWTENKEPRRLLKRKLLAPEDSVTQSTPDSVAVSTETEAVTTPPIAEQMESDQTEEINYEELYEQKPKGM